MREHLAWTEEEQRDIFECRVFSIHESVSRSPTKETTGVFTVIDAPDWAIVVPVLETERGKCFVMVWQWRHGAQEMSLEFPGGVCESGEHGEAAALRELEEETAYTAGKITKLAEMNPNPAIMSNHQYIFVAEDLQRLPFQHLDEDEYVEVEIVPVDEVIKNMGKPPYIHAIMAAALGLYNARPH